MVDFADIDRNVIGLIKESEKKYNVDLRQKLLDFTVMIFNLLKTLQSLKCMMCFDINYPDLQLQ